MLTTKIQGCLDITNSIENDPSWEANSFSDIQGRNSNQVNKDIRNNEDIIKLTQNGVDKNGEEKFNQDEDETPSDNSDDKNGELDAFWPCLMN